MVGSSTFVPAEELPILPDSWQWRRLGDLVDQTRGICYGIVQPGKHDDSGIPMVNSQDVLDGSVARRIEFRVAGEIHAKFRRSTLRGGEILLTLVGANFGRAAIAPENFAGFNCSRAVGVIPGCENPQFVMFCLRSPFMRRFLDNWANTTAQPTFNLKEVSNLPIPLPPPAEQRKIAAILGSLDDKIELNRRMNATLEAMARALFQSWFVDFDPVCAKLDGRSPANLDAATAALFPASFQDSLLGPIPQGWKEGTLGDIGTNPRRTIQPSEIAPNTSYIALEHMPRQCIALDNWDESADVVSGKFAFNKGEVLFGKLRPYFHKVGIAPLNGVCSTDILVLTPKDPEWLGFLIGHASSEALVQFADLASTGTKMPRTNWSDLSSFRVGVPPLPIAAAFTHYVEPMFERIIANVHQSRTLATLRDTLLPKLLSGELSVSTAAETIP